MMKRDMNMTIVCGRLLLVLLCLPLPMYGAADTLEQEPPAGVDISSWACNYCPFEQGYSGEVEIGAGTVSESSYKFGEYNGLHDNGAFPIGNASVRYRNPDADYLDLRIRDLGLDNGSVDIEGGRQGSYSLFLNYDEISHYISDSARTPYQGIGGDRLVLPPGWPPGATTDAMPELTSSLQHADLKTERKRMGLGFSFIPARRWETAVNVRHEQRDGQKGTAGAIFYTDAAQLVEPIDYVTDEVDVSVSYTTRKWQSRLAYYGSFFNNHDDALYWQNAYTVGFGSWDAGQRALPPDNQFHQILLSSGYQLSEDTRVSGDIALGRMEQDDNLLPATINGNVNPVDVALPTDSANARIDTMTANLKVSSAVSKKLRLDATYRYNERDNKTPVESFNWVSTESQFLPAPRINETYSFTDNTFNLGGKYRLSNKTRLGAGYEYETKKRTNQEVDKTKENTFWGEVSVQARDNIDVSFKAAHAIRDASGYHPYPQENPLMRKYNLADRSRDSGGIQVGFIPHERVSIGLSIDYAKDDYTDSVLGLTESREIGYNLDASVLMTDATSLHAFAGRQQIKSEQAGSAAFPPPGEVFPPDWIAKNDDTIDSFGFGVQHQLIKDKLDVGADFVLSRSTGEVSVSPAATGVDFPDLKTDLDTLKLYADYTLKDNMTLHAAYWYEHYNSKSWMLDGVYPDTIPNVIAFGEESPDYNVQAVMMSVRYRF